MVHHSPLPPDLEALVHSQPEVHQPVALAPVRGRRYRLDHRHKACHTPPEHRNRTIARGNPRKRQGSVPYVSRLGRRQLDATGPHPARVSVDSLARTASAPLEQHFAKAPGTSGLAPREQPHPCGPILPVRRTRHVEPTARPEAQGCSPEQAMKPELNP
jgi:hypothetical protein